MSGLVYARAGGTPEHNRIVMRLTLLVGNQLAPPCEAYGSDQKIRTSHAGFFPDLLVVCGNPRVAVDDPNAFTNPSIVFEVLSASTAAIDQTTKADEYKSLPSLKAYVLTWQTWWLWRAAPQLPAKVSSSMVQPLISATSSELAAAELDPRPRPRRS